jgi:hypothetical protein
LGLGLDHGWRLIGLCSDAAGNSTGRTRVGRAGAGSLANLGDGLVTQRGLVASPVEQSVPTFQVMQQEPRSLEILTFRWFRRQADT